jgi:hypothetical protein
MVVDSFVGGVVDLGDTLTLTHCLEVLKKPFCSILEADGGFRHVSCTERSDRENEGRSAEEVNDVGCEVEHGSCLWSGVVVGSETTLSQTFAGLKKLFADQ